MKNFKNTRKTEKINRDKITLDKFRLFNHCLTSSGRRASPNESPEARPNLESARGDVPRDSTRVGSDDRDSRDTLESL